MNHDARQLVYFVCATMLALTIVSCDIRSNGARRNTSAVVPAAAPTPTSSQREAVSSPSSSSPIREVDFRNFTYPWYPSGYPAPRGERKITLRNGEMKVEAATNINRLRAGIPNVSYADLTGDGQEEAIVTVVANFDPNGSVACIFIYTLRNGEPKLLWSHETGDRADGGLRSLRVEGLDLVVEQYDIKFDWAKGSYEEGTALCCPKRFIRSRYRWDGERFEKTGSETLPNESKTLEFLGYPRDQSKG
jgi:hypothetical protein